MNMKGLIIKPSDEWEDQDDRLESVCGLWEEWSRSVSCLEVWLSQAEETLKVLELQEVRGDRGILGEQARKIMVGVYIDSLRVSESLSD